MAIPKVALLDPTQKESLEETIVAMLADRSILVLGAVVMTWNEVCPDRLDYIHPYFKKICRLVRRYYTLDVICRLLIWMNGLR